MSEPNVDLYRPSPDYWAARKAANHWRSTQGQDRCLTTGVVRVYDGRVYGWSAALGTPRTERPGALAIDAHGNLWEARGGRNDQDSATAWDEIEQPAYPGRAGAGR